VIEPEVAERRAAAEHSARQLEAGGERVAIARGQLALEQAHHGRVTDREPAGVFGRTVQGARVGGSMVEHARP